MTAAHITARVAREGLPTPCVADPDRWLESGDDPELKVLCRGCPRRWQCANDALETPAVEGMWAAVYVPSERGRGRAFALRQLRSLVAYADDLTPTTHQ
jgi:WhiB family redox-sensing transcriptional regulator